MGLSLTHCLHRTDVFDHNVLLIPFLKGSRREYGHYNLDELNEGSRISVMRKSCGTLHYFINGVDQVWSKLGSF